MPLSAPVSRQLRHQRVIRTTAYERDDGLWDIDACVTDHKPRDIFVAGGVRRRGLPIHELWLRITVDRQLTIVNAESSSDWAPYGDECRAINTAYRALIGLNLLQQFRHAVKERLSGTNGCAHLTELCGVLPTAAIQAFAGDVWPVGEENGDSPQEPASAPPFQLGRCHALRFDGEVVRQFFPVWYGRVQSDLT